MKAASAYIEQKLASNGLTYDDLAALVSVAQLALGVDADGKPGKTTLAALYTTENAKKMPVPSNRKEVELWAGPLPWRRTTPGKRSVTILTPRWAHKIKRFRLHTGKTVRLHVDVGAEFIQLFQRACEVSGYTPRSAQGYNPRTIGTTKRLSMHTYGLAVDLDPSDNWLGGIVRNTKEPSLLRQYSEFVRVFTDAGWTWGGDWKMRDDMHFQRAGV